MKCFIFFLILCFIVTKLCVLACDIIHNGGKPQHMGWGGDELLNKVIILVFFAHNKYSRRFIKLQLSTWCHMNYYTDVLAMFLDLDRVMTIAVYGRVRELSDLIKNIIICVPKMNKCLTGLELCEGE